MDGLRLLARLREAAGGRGESMQAILCSGAADLDDLDTAMRVGVAAFVPKPIERASLLNALGDAQRRYARLEQDRSARSKLIDRCRTLEGALGEVVRDLAEMSALPPRPTSAPSPGAAMPKLDAAWHAHQVRAMLREAETLDRLLARHEVDAAEWRILLALREADLLQAAASVTNIALASGASATAGLRRIAALEARGLVVRGDDAADARRAMLRLSAAGLALCKEAVEAIVVQGSAA
jgi:DNA-binding MarR family transcriptional regulator